MPRRGRRVIAGCVALAALANAPARQRAVHRAAAGPGFHYIFDGTATGRTPRSTSGSSPPARSRSRPRPGPGDAGHGRGLVQGRRLAVRRLLVPGEPFGDAVFRIQFTVENTPPSTRNGGVMIRTPDVRYTRREHATARPRAEAAGLQLRRLPGRHNPRSATLTDAGRVARPTRGAASPGPFPPRGAPSLHRRLLRAQAPPGVYDVNGLNNQPLTINGNADNGAALDAGLLRPRDPDQRVADRHRPARRLDPIKTGSVYGFRNLNAQQSGTVQAPRQGRLAPVRDPHDRPAVHDPGRRRDDQPVRQLDPEDRHARG